MLLVPMPQPSLDVEAMRRHQPYLNRLAQLLLDIFYGALKFRIRVDHIIHRAHTVDHRAMVAAAKTVANRLERMIRDVFGKVHGQLSGQHDVALQDR